MEYQKINKIVSFYLTIVLLCLGVFGQATAQQSTLAELIQKARNSGIEQSALDDLQTRAESRGISEQQLINIVEPAVSLAGENLPADHVIRKALEGLSKGAPGPQIVSVINQMRNSTQQAAGVVDPWMENANVQQMVARTLSGGGAPGQQIRNNMIKAASKALSQSIPAESINQILSAVSDESILSKTTPLNIVAAISILPDLPVTEQPGTTESFIVRALRGGFNGGELQQLPAAINMAQMRSQLPASSILEGVAKQLQGGIPAAGILQNLFKGNIGGGPPGHIPNIPDRGNRNGS